MIGPLPLRDHLSPWWLLAAAAVVLLTAPTGVVVAQAVAGTHSAQRTVVPQSAPSCSDGGRW